MGGGAPHRPPLWQGLGGAHPVHEYRRNFEL